MSKTKENKQAIREWYKTFGVLPYERAMNELEARLGRAVVNYCCPSQLCYDRNFHKWARSVGFINQSEKAAIQRYRIKKFYEQHGRLPKRSNDPTETDLAVKIPYYANPSQSSYNEEFAVWVQLVRAKKIDTAA